jgi:hypothetical protein
LSALLAIAVDFLLTGAELYNRSKTLDDALVGFTGFEILLLEALLAVLG